MLVAIAMSGGVDSSTAAALLVEQGYRVFGVMMRLWSPHSGQVNRCCSPEDLSIARNIAAQLGIPFYMLDARAPFKKYVVDDFVHGYAKGITPNPCLNCNIYVRWNFFLRRAMAMGASHVATGHYARILSSNHRFQLLRSKDRAKDQTYVLSFLNQTQLSHTLFPLGGYTKPEVRDHARRLRLPVAERRDSQDLCFAGGRRYWNLLEDLDIPLPPPGPIVDLEGNLLGQHQGLAQYTIGQRRRLGISSPSPLYVLAKDFSQNKLIVGPKASLARNSFITRGVNWINPDIASGPVQATIRTRYRSKEVQGKIIPLAKQRARIILDEPLRDITPGQAAVFYQGEVCLGGGIIQA